MENKKRVRITKDEYYLNIAKAVSLRSTCLRRMYGSVIVKNDKIVSTGYNGSPRGEPNCCDTGSCYRKENNIPNGERYEACKSSHSENNATVSASSEQMFGATLYLVGIDYDTNELLEGECKPCDMCRRTIVNSGLAKVVSLSKLGITKTLIPQ